VEIQQKSLKTQYSIKSISLDVRWFLSNNLGDAAALHASTPRHLRLFRRGQLALPGGRQHAARIRPNLM
jgi:hypothetical protein